MAKNFVAKVTPVADQKIGKGDTVKGVRYSKMPGATVVTRGRGGKPNTMVRTVMAFGPSNAAVANILRPGKTVEVLCQYDRGTIRIVGKAPSKAIAA